MFPLPVPCCRTGKRLVIKTCRGRMPTLSLDRLRRVKANLRERVETGPPPLFFYTLNPFTAVTSFIVGGSHTGAIVSGKVATHNQKQAIGNILTSSHAEATF